MTVDVMAECLDLLAHGLPDRIQKGLPENGGRVRLFAHGFLTVLGLILRRAESSWMVRYSSVMCCRPKNGSAKGFCMFRRPKAPWKAIPWPVLPSLRR